MPPLRVQWIAVLTALAVLFPGSAFARTQYFCRMMNRVVATCCCDSDGQSRVEANSAQVRASDCCERLTTAARPAAVRAVAKDFSVPPAALVATIPAPVYVFRTTFAAHTLPAQARAPPGVGPPLFVLNCSFLT